MTREVADTQIYQEYQEVAVEKPPCVGTVGGPREAQGLHQPLSLVNKKLQGKQDLNDQWA